MSSMRHRTTLYAAFAGDGTPVINVYDFDRRRLEVHVAERKGNGYAFDGEHIVQITIAKYNRLLAARGWDQVRTDGTKRRRGG